MQLKIMVLAMGVLSTSFVFAQDNQKVVDVRQIRDAAMKQVEIKVKPVSSSSIRLTMEGEFYQTFIERANGDIFVVAQVNANKGVVSSFYLPVKMQHIDNVLAFLKPNFSMIENGEARQFLSSLRMIYNIDTAFPMYVNRIHDRWVLLIDSHADNVRFVGFTAKINGDGIIQELVFSNEITLSDAQRKDIAGTNKTSL